MNFLKRMFSPKNKNVYGGLTLIPNAVIRDKNLSYGAKGLYAMLQILTLGEIFKAVDKDSKDNADTLFNLLHELIEAGYISFNG